MVKGAKRQRPRTARQKVFISVMARTNDHEYAASKAGFVQPATAGWKLLQNEIIRDAVRSEALKFLDEKAGPAAVYNLAQIMLDEAQPAGARVRASEIIGKWSGMAGDEEGGGKELHEMTGDELRAEIRRQHQRTAAIERALADQAKPVIEQEIIPSPGAFD